MYTHMRTSTHKSMVKMLQLSELTHHNFHNVQYEKWMFILRFTFNSVIKFILNDYLIIAKFI